MIVLDEEERLVLRVLSYAASNALLFIAFSVLWLMQYHMDSSFSHLLDAIVAPWVWLAGFFAASFLSIRRPKLLAIPVAAGTAITLSGVLFLFVRIVLVPMYDPMF